MCVSSAASVNYFDSAGWADLPAGIALNAALRIDFVALMRAHWNRAGRAVLRALGATDALVVDGIAYERLAAPSGAASAQMLFVLLAKVAQR
jgi:hypothetical protein